MSNDHVALSRRGFLKGTLATAGVALAGASHAGDIPAEWAKPKCSNWSWEKPMEKIPADQIKKTVDTDVVVIGAGLTGFSAALSAAEEGAKVVVVEKTRSWSARGGHITAFGSKVQKSMKVNVDAAEIVRRLIAWGQGRMDERLLWMFAKKCGACMDWAVDLAAKNDVKVTLWEGYYKGPTYTEFPVTHFFYNKDVSLDYTYGNSTGIGNVVLMPCFEKELKAKGVNIMYRTPAVQLIREKNNGRVTGLIVGRRGNYTRINAKKGVIIATGCYASNMEMRKCYSPYSLRVDAQIYYPTKSNTGDGHIMAMQIGGVMQKNDNHAATVHLEAGAASYGFLHVNGQGNRFMNEDVNTQSKSCSKELQDHGIAWSVYDSEWLGQVKKQVDGNMGGGLFYGQMWQPWGAGWNVDVEKATQAQHIKDGKVAAVQKKMPSRRSTKLRLYADDMGRKLTADGSDFIVVVAEVTDDNGNVKRLASDNIQFTVEGEGRIIGEGEGIMANPRRVEWGTAPVLIQATNRPGKITVTARSAYDGNYAPTPATLTIESVPYDVPTCFNEMPAYKITPARQSSRQANKGGMSEEERQRTLEEVNRQQAEFGVQK